MTTIQIPDEIVSEYEARARAAGRDAMAFIREALIEKLEDMEDIEIAEARYAERRESIPIEQVVKNLGLED